MLRIRAGRLAGALIPLPAPADPLPGSPAGRPGSPHFSANPAAASSLPVCIAWSKSTSHSRANRSSGLPWFCTLVNRSCQPPVAFPPSALPGLRRWSSVAALPARTGGPAAAAGTISRSLRQFSSSHHKARPRCHNACSFAGIIHSLFSGSRISAAISGRKAAWKMRRSAS